MSKALLLMNMPERCNQCELCWCQDYEYFCIPDDFSHYLNINATERPDWCPLKEVPKKESGADIFDEFDTGFERGWNDCIDKIMEGSEEND